MHRLQRLIDTKKGLRPAEFSAGLFVAEKPTEKLTFSGLCIYFYVRNLKNSIPKK